MISLYIFHTSWYRNLFFVEDIINSIPSSVTKFPPISFYTEKYPIRPWNDFPSEKIDIDALISKTRLLFDKIRSKYAQNDILKDRKQTVFRVNDLVLLKKVRKSNYKKNIDKKLTSIFEGPYVVTDIIGVKVYKIADCKTLNTRGIFSVENLFPYRG